MNIKSLFKRFKDPVFRAKVDSRYGLGKLEQLYYSNWLNPFATIYVNLRSFPFKQAIKLPFWVYGRPRFYSLSGYMRIDGQVKSGMIKFNYVQCGAPSNMSVKSELVNRGFIEFKGRCIFGTGNKVIIGLGKTLSMGNLSKIMDMCTVVVHERMTIGDYTQISHRSQVMDSNYHFIADFNNGQISKRTAPVIIGKSCWICNSASIMPGSIIPDYCIVGSNSLVNKKFADIPQKSLIAGIPARFIGTGVTRVFNDSLEPKIWKYWRENPDAETFPLSEFTQEELSTLSKSI